jgi:ATP-dependent Zn protease
MSNIIKVDFRNGKMSEREQYLNFLAVELDEMDFQDFVEAVNDPDGAVYRDLDEDMQVLVTAFFAKAG